MIKKHLHPRVSILLPVYNGARYISEAIESVLNQNFSDWELLVIDDASTDQTSSIVSSYVAQDNRIRYIKNAENLRLQKTLNRGLANARGQYIARVDDDDMWVDDEKLHKQVKFLDSHPDHALVGTGVVEINEDGEKQFRYLQPEHDEEIRDKILRRNCFTHSSVMFRKDAISSLGGYGETIESLHVEDYELWLRLGRQWKFANLPSYSTAWRLRSSSIGARNKKMVFRQNLRLIHRYGPHYPGRIRAQILAFARYYLYSIFLYMPGKKIIRYLYRKI